MNAPATARPAPQPLKLPKRAPALPANALKGAATERGHFFCIVPNETTLEEICTPAYWQHHIGALSGGQTHRPFARIEVVRVDGSLDVDLRVVSTAPGMAVVRVLRAFVDNRDLNLADTDKGDETLVLPEGYKTVQIPAGEKKGWRVTMPNGEELASKIVKRRDAVAIAIAHHAKANTILDPAAGSQQSTS